MIVLYSGIPGSGKSYKMVHDLEEEKKKHFVIHNIDGLKEGYLSESEGFNFLKYCENEKMEVEDFFSKDYQIELTEAIRAKYGKNCLVIVDECHEWFDRNKKTLKMWLSYHRHLNQDIWLVAHRSSNLPSVYRSFIEVEYRAKFSSIFALPGFFIYNRILAGEAVGYTFARKKKHIFELYKSMAAGFKKKMPSLLLPILALLIIGGVWYFFTLPGKLQKSKVDKAKSSISENQVSGVSGGSVPVVSFIYAGKLGFEYLVQEVNSSKIIKISDMPGKMIFFQANDSELTLFDTELKKLVVLKRFVLAVPSISKGFLNDKFKQ